MSTGASTLFEELVMEDLKTSKGSLSHIVVYNDDVNTFDWVIESLMEVCDHTFEQAEQCSLLIHFKGKASVKTGAFKSLHPLKDALTERGLSAVIETTVTD
jgi:ATP-dependent Clp protease adaptor protein ClpS